jgi:hypothetical protein
MNTTSPLARGVRTFVALLAGASVGWVGINLATDFKTGATKIGLGVVGALLGGILAWLYALIPLGPNATTPFGKAFATFLQGIVSGLGTFAFADITLADFQRFGLVTWTVVGASLSAAVITFLTNAAEGAPTPAA